MTVIGPDVLRAAGPLQLCAGHTAGCEAAVHALRDLFRQADTDAIILVDASNAFNNLNRQVALHNIRYQCPAISTMLINCYRGNAPLFVDGSGLLSQEGTTQGDPLSMAMFALASVPLINRIASPRAPQVWFADDAASGGALAALREWWDRLNEVGPQYGYFPNAVKTSIVVKPEKYNEAVEMFRDTGVTITNEGKRYLGAALGSDQFASDFLKSKISAWTAEVEQLAKFASSQPQAAFTALTHGLISRWAYMSRVSPSSEELLQPLETALRFHLIPALTGQPSPSDSVRQLLALPARHGGMGMINPTALPARQHPASLKVCAPLVRLIMQQSGDVTQARSSQQHLKRQLIKQFKADCLIEASALTASLPSSLRRCATAAQETGASVWLTALPLKSHGFALHKGAFRDAIALRYDWPLAMVPTKCVCGEQFTPDHAMICRYGGYPTLRHNEVRDLVAGFLREVGSDVCCEPRLQPLTGERLPASANKDDEARLDVRARGFWSNDGQDAFFDVRVFHPFAPSYRNSSLPSLYRQHEQQKKREYGRRVREIERGCFTPLVFSTGGGMAPEATTFLKRLASLLSDKRKEPYSVTMNCLRCFLSYSLLRSALLCVRGSRSIHRRSTCVSTGCLSLTAAECRLLS